MARDRIGRWALLAFIAFLVLIQCGNALGDAPPSVAAIAWVGQAQWLLVAWAMWIDRHRAVALTRVASEAAGYTARHFLAERLQTGRRAHHHLELDDPSAVVEPDQVDSLQFRRAHARGKLERDIVAAANSR